MRPTPVLVSRPGWLRIQPSQHPRLHRAVARFSLPQSAREDTPEIKQQRPGEARGVVGQAFEVLQRHFGEYHRGKRTYPCRPGRAVKEGHLADQAASLKAAGLALTAEPGWRPEDFESALEQNIERATAATGLKDVPPGAEPQDACEFKERRPVRLRCIR